MSEIKVLLTILASIILTITAQKQQLLKHPAKPKRSLSINPIFTTVFQNAGPSTSLTQKFFEGIRDNDTIIWRNIDTNSENVPQIKELFKPTSWISETTDKFVYGLPKTENSLPFGGYTSNNEYGVPTNAAQQWSLPNTADLTPFKEILIYNHPNPSKFQLPEVTLSTPFVTPIATPKKSHEYPNNNENLYFKYALPTTKVADDYFIFKPAESYGLPRETENPIPFGGYEFKKEYDVPTITTIQWSVPNTADLAPVRKKIISNHLDPLKFELPEVTHSTSFLKTIPVARESHEYPHNNENPNFKYALPTTKIADGFLNFKPKETYEFPKNSEYAASSEDRLPNNKVFSQFVAHADPYDSASSTQLRSSLQHSIKIPAITYVPPEVNENEPPKITVSDHWVEQNPKENYGVPKKNVNPASTQYDLANSKLYHAFLKNTISYNPNITLTPVNVFSQNFVEVPFHPASLQATSDDLRNNQVSDPNITLTPLNVFSPNFVEVPFHPASLQATSDDLQNNHVPEFFVEYKPQGGRPKKHIEIASFQVESGLSVSIPLIPEKKIEQKHEEYGVPHLDLPVQKRAKRSSLSIVPEHFNLIPDSYWNRYNEIAKADNDEHELKSPQNFEPSKDETPIENNDIKVTQFSVPHKNYIVTVTRTDRTDPPLKNNKHFKTDYSDSPNKHNIVFYVNGVRQDISPDSFMRKNNKLYSDFTDVFSSSPSTKTSVKNINLNGQNYKLFQEASNHYVARALQRRAKRSISFNPIFSSVFTNADPTKHLANKFLEGASRGDRNSWNTHYYAPNHPHHTNIPIPYWSSKVKNCEQPNKKIAKPFKEYGLPNNINLKPLASYGIPYLSGRPKFVVGKPFKEYGAPKAPVSRPHEVYGISYPKTHKPAVNYGPPKFGISKPFQEYNVPKLSVPEPFEFYGIPYPGASKPAINYGPPKIVVSKPFKEYSVPKAPGSRPHEVYGISDPETHKPAVNYGPPKFEISKPFHEYDVPKVSVPEPYELYGIPYPGTNKPAINYGPPKFVVSKPFKEYNVPKAPGSRPHEVYGISDPETHKPAVNYGPPKFEISKPFHEYDVPKVSVPEPYELYGIPYPGTNKPAINYGPPKFVVSKPFKEYSVPKASMSRPNEFYGISHLETHQPAVNYGPPKFEISKPFHEYDVPKVSVPEPYELYGIPYPGTNKPAINYGPPKFVVSKPFKEYSVPKAPGSRPHEVYGISDPETHKPAVNYGPPKFEISKPFHEYDVPKVSVPEPYELYGIPYPGTNKPAINYGPPKFVVSKPFKEYSAPKASMSRPNEFYEISHLETHQPAINYGPPKFGISKPFQEYDVTKAPVPEPHELYGISYPEASKPAINYGPPKFVVSIPFKKYSVPKVPESKPNEFHGISYPETNKLTTNYGPPKFEISKPFQEYEAPKASLRNPHDIYIVPNQKDTSKVPRVQVSVPFKVITVPNQGSHKTQFLPYTLPKFGKSQRFIHYTTPKLSSIYHHTVQVPITIADQSLEKNKLPNHNNFIPFNQNIPTVLSKIGNENNLPNSNIPIFQNKQSESFIFGLPNSDIRYSFGPSKNYILHTKTPSTNQEKHLPNLFSTKTFNILQQEARRSFIAPKPILSNSFHEFKGEHKNQIVHVQGPTLIPSLPDKLPKNEKIRSFQIHDSQLHGSQVTFSHSSGKDNILNTPKINRANFFIPAFYDPNAKVSRQGSVSKPIDSHASFSTPQTSSVLVEISKPTKQDSIANILPQLPKLHTSSTIHSFRLHTPSSEKAAQNIPQHQNVNKSMAKPIETHSLKQDMYAPIFPHSAQKILVHHTQDVHVPEPTYIQKHPHVLVPNDLPTALKENIDYNSKFFKKYLYKQNAGPRENLPVSSEVVNINNHVKDIVSSFFRNKTNKIEHFNIGTSPNSPNQEPIVSKLPTEKSLAYVNEDLIRNNNSQSNFLKPPKNKFSTVKYNSIQNNDLSNDIKGVLMPKLFKKHSFLLSKVEGPKFDKTGLKNDPITKVKDIVASYFKNKNLNIGTLINGPTAIVATKLPDVTPEVVPNNSLHTTKEFTESNRSDIPVEQDLIPSDLTQKDIGLKNKTYNKGIYRHPNLRYASSNEINKSLHTRKNVTQLHNSTGPNAFINSNGVFILKSSKLQNYENNESTSTSSPISVENGYESVNSDSSVDKNIVSYDNSLEDSKKKKLLLRVIKRPMYTKNNIGGNMVNKDGAYHESMDETILYERNSINV